MEKKRINSKRKGNAAELELAKILTKRFDLSFARVGVSSGARVKNTRLPDHAMSVMAGDIIVPHGFRFGTIEVKSRKHAINYRTANKELDSFIEQAELDAKQTGKPPFICIKVNRQDWDTMVPLRVFSAVFFNCEFYTRYKNFLVYKLETLLSFDQQGFWFN